MVDELILKILAVFELGVIFFVMTSPKSDYPRAAFDAEAFGDALRAARLKQGWSKAGLARLAGLDRATIAVIENGGPSLHAQTVQNLIRSGVFANAEPQLEGWEEFPEPYRKLRGMRARAAREVGGQTLTQIAAAAGVSPASLSLFERDLSAPRKIVGPFAQDSGARVVNSSYAQALGFSDADDMIDYIEADDPKAWLKAIAEDFGRDMPPAALLPTAPPPDPA